MDVKKYLEQALDLDSIIESHVAELDQYRRLAMTIGSSRLEEHVSHSAPTEAPYVKWVERIVDMERQINDEIDRLVAVKAEIRNLIEKTDNPKWRHILRSRYIMGLSWEQIAVEMGCTTRHIQRLHKEIITELERVIKCREMSSNATATAVDS